MGYALWVAAGLLLAGIAARWQKEGSGLEPAQRSRLALVALVGAILGAYGLQLPADLFGWNAPPPAGVAGDGMPLGGRTVLGGLLGGWLAVEVQKRRAHIRRPTGDEFALPLALALACGRLGCLAAGCCAGVPCEPGPWAWVDAAGVSRVPVQAIEAAFHFGAAVLLACGSRRGWQPGRRLLLYFAAYAVVRFALEFWRQNPRVVAFLTWHQMLAMLLFVLASAAWVQRTQAGSLP
jgi:phosphatidylglycerol:prolipoprotein diacylglycerol transferase